MRTEGFEKFFSTTFGTRRPVSAPPSSYLIDMYFSNNTSNGKCSSDQQAVCMPDLSNKRVFMILSEIPQLPPYPSLVINLLQNREQWAWQSGRVVFRRGAYDDTWQESNPDKSQTHLVPQNRLANSITHSLLQCVWQTHFFGHLKAAKNKRISIACLRHDTESVA